ncbi:hypothetical protein [Delftia acidovorans]|uniref:hypothetical protein n=1 Tax=Delftia acidovorans TaxID=80866 RepID=UPI0028B169B5|nr:hypothetical protein [Delftia acidovorans]
MRYLFYVFAIRLNFSSSYAKDIENREPECLVGVDSKKFVASFQIIDKDQKYGLLMIEVMKKMKSTIIGWLSLG